MKIEQRIYDGKIYYEAFYNDEGKLHNDNGPAVISKSMHTLMPTSEHYYKDGVRHRDGPFPSSIFYNNNGTIHEVKFSENGSYKQGIGPNVIQYHDNGLIKFEYYFDEHAFYSRLDGPAYIEYDTTGKIVCEIYYFLNKRYLDINFYKADVAAYLRNKEKSQAEKVVPNNICKKCNCKDDYLGETGLCYKCFQP